MDNLYNNCDIDCMKFVDIIVDIVNYYYYDLQMYSNYVVSIDNGTLLRQLDTLSESNNIKTKIKSITDMYYTPENRLFRKKKMILLSKLIDEFISRDPCIIIPNKKKYDAAFFRTGVVSTSMLFKKDNPSTIIKTFPCKLYHHYQYCDDKFIKIFIESPLYALYFKEAWMICFSKQKLSQYTPVFGCMISCYMTNNLPVYLSDTIKNEYQNYVLNNPNMKKKWFENMIKNNGNLCVEFNGDKNTSNFGCFEMVETEGTLLDLNVSIKEINKKIILLDIFSDKKQLSDDAFQQLNITHDKLNKLPMSKKNGHALRTVTNVIENQKSIREYNSLKQSLIEKKIDLSFFFEYMYGKLVVAYIGRIIFTDDHFGNIAYITVDYYRHYKIKCNGCNYHFYMHPGKMVQFIDLERYIFNYSRYDIYTNSALQNISDDDFINNTQLHNIKSNYLNNDYIVDKGIYQLADPRELDPKTFVDDTEYQIMVNIIIDNFIYDIKTFCQIMSMYLPKKYMTKIDDDKMKHYYIDLDDDSIRIINKDFIEKQIINGILK